MASSLPLTGLLDKFPSGTTVGAYPQSNWATYQLPPSGSPVGSATATANVSAAGAVTLTGLADDTDYFITDSSGTKYVSSSTRVSHSGFEEALGGDFTGTLPNPTIGAGKVTGAKVDPATVMRADTYSATARTIYVDHVSGSDANTGRSPGAALQTLPAAIRLLLSDSFQTKGRIAFVEGGAVAVNAPLHIASSVTIDCITPSAVELQRNFDTTASRSFWDAVTTAAGSSCQSATASFVAGDVNKIISIYGAGTNGGTYYDFISAVPDGTHATLTATTAVARNSTTDPKGVKGQVVGDWNRVVTDAGITSGQSVVSSAMAAWAATDVGTELIIAGAGQGGQALRSVILSVSGNNATIKGVASATVSNKRCAIGVNFGDLITFHTGACGLENFILADRSSSSTRIGSALKFVSEDGGSGSQNAAAKTTIRDIEITSSLAAGAWEHEVECDGSWNELSSGPGVRRIHFVNPTIFGSRRPGETIRLAGAVHWSFTGGGMVGSAPLSSVGQGIMVLDPANSAAAGFQSATDVFFAGFEGFDAYFYCEGQRCTFHGGSLGAIDAISGRRTIELSPLSANCSVVTTNASTLTGTNADEYDAGTGNTIRTNVWSSLSRPIDAATIPTVAGVNGVETFPRLNLTNASQSVGSSGVLVAQGIVLRGGKVYTKVKLHGGGTALAWGSGWSNPHFIYGLYDPDLNLIAQTADTGGTAAFSSTFTMVNFTSSVTIPRSGLCYIALLINSGTGGSGFTYPTFGGQTNNAAALSPILCGTVGSGLTALPNPLGSLAGANSMIWGMLG